MNRSNATGMGIRLSCAMSLLLAAGLVFSPRTFANDPTASPAAPSDLPASFSFTPESAVERLRQENATDPVGAELEAIEATLKQALKAEPKNARWHYGLGLVERERRNAGTDEATRRPHADAYFKHLTEATKVDKKNADYFALLGEATMGTMKPGDGFMTMASVAGDARDAWEKAVELDPNHVEALYSLAMYEIQARKQGGMLFGSYKTAKKHGEKLVTLPKGKYLGHTTLGSVSAAQQEWDEMAKQYALAEQAATTDSQRATTLYTHANSLITEKKDAKAAMPIIERMAALQPDNYSVYFLRASAKKLAGDCAGAIDDFKEVLTKNPGAMNTRFMLAECYESTGDTASAIAMYQEFKAKFPNDGRVEKADKAIKKIKAKKKG